MPVSRGVRLLHQKFCSQYLVNMRLCEELKNPDTYSVSIPLAQL